ncbi:hypothetical protein CYY_006623 [Polysphondylium violaceum]|uniref:SD-repeat containing protein B domain-containing protein n=1 Tax=Polysphondylium violaceum TaxID=133409 RepID=A0A8J4PQC7_9MYCE|nr:hypothetical protein CYY_006623 [Polysphondylium violaceum]
MKNYLIFILLLICLVESKEIIQQNNLVYPNKTITPQYPISEFIYKNSLGNWIDYGWGSKNISNQNNFKSSPSSISLSSDSPTSGLYFFPKNRDFVFTLNQKIRFFINVGPNVDAPITISLTKLDQTESKVSLNLLDIKNPSRSALKIPFANTNSWYKVEIPISYFEKKEVYSALMIKMGHYLPGATIYFDDLEIITNDPKLYTPSTKTTTTPKPTFTPKTNSTQAKKEISPASSILSPDKQAKLPSEFGAKQNYEKASKLTDFSFQDQCNLEKNEYIAKVLESAKPFYSEDEHSFFTNQTKYFNGGPQWIFLKQMGRLKFFTNGEILVEGPIILKNEFKGDMVHIKSHPLTPSWWVNLHFYPVKAPPTSHLKMELPEELYYPQGRIDPTFWAFYMPNNSLSYFEGLGNNKGKRLNVNGVDMEMPLMMGEGANGKNTKIGMSVWLTFENNVTSTPTPTPTKTTFSPATTSPSSPMDHDMMQEDENKIVMDLNLNIVDLPPVNRIFYPYQICNNHSVALGMHVFLDRNSNSVREYSEFGLPGVKVSLVSALNSTVMDISGNPIQPVISDHNGLVYFDKIPYGKYYIHYEYEQHPLRISTDSTMFPNPLSTKSNLLDISLQNPGLKSTINNRYPVNSCFIIENHNINLIM